MTNFGNYLGQVIASEFEGHRSNFAARCGLNPASITNYLMKDDLPSPPNLGRVANAISDPFHRAELLAAYWRDLQDGAGIKGVDVRFRPADAKALRDTGLDATIAAIERRARIDPKYRRIVEDIAGWP